MDRKKKILSVILVAVMITISISMSGYQKKTILAVAAEDVGIDISDHTPTKGEDWEEDNIWYSIYDDHVEVNSYRGTDGNMEIKPYIQGKPVTQYQIGMMFMIMMVAGGEYRKAVLILITK